MNINADFDKRVVVHSEQIQWLASPMQGVFRRPLDRVGTEVARATSIANSQFSPHVHTGGEEFIVLECVFQDEQGDFPAGSYVRNPPQSNHQPSSDEGCVIFVKLWQFEPKDRTHLRINTHFMKAIPHREFTGIAVTPLYYDGVEDVAIFNIDANRSIQMPTDKGAEILVLVGDLTEGHDELVQHSWLRVPIASNLHIKAGNQGAKIWLKQGHLHRVNKEMDLVKKA